MLHQVIDASAKLHLGKEIEIMSLKIGLLLVSTATLFLSIVTIGQQKQLNELRKILNTITKTERDKLIDGLNTQVEDCLTEDEVEW